jgi:hypothetical protein
MDNKQIIFSSDSSYAGFSFIANHLPHTPMLYRRKRADFDKMIKRLVVYDENPTKFIKAINQSEEIIVFGVMGLKYLFRILKNQAWFSKKNLSDWPSRKLIISDIEFSKSPAYYNQHIINNDVEILIMPDLIHQLHPSIPYRPYFQHIPFNKQLLLKKDPRLTVAHSPGLKRYSNEKATTFIETTLNSYNLDIIHGFPWHECVKRKSKATFFVDQMCIFKNLDYYGGLGKSGLEAMLYGCLTITTGYPPKTEPHFPLPPALYIHPSQLRDTIDHYLFCEDERNELISRQQQWAKKYLSVDFVSANILTPVKDHIKPILNNYEQHPGNNQSRTETLPAKVFAKKVG